MKCNRTCQGFCSWIEALPYHVRYPLPKESVPMLPECFRETLLGERVSGAGKQLRGPYGVHEFPDRWGLASTFALAVGKMMKLLDGDPGDGQSAGPNQASTNKER